jgi:hypothetical protein
MTDDLAILENYINQCSNWGRWGPHDQLGTVNLITPEKVREAAALVNVGKTISLTMPTTRTARRTATWADRILICISSYRDRDILSASKPASKPTPWPS